MAKMLKQQELLKKQDEELLKNLKLANGYFDAYKSKGQNIHLMMKKLKNKEENQK